MTWAINLILLIMCLKKRDWVPLMADHVELSSVGFVNISKYWGCLTIFSTQGCHLIAKSGHPTYIFPPQIVSLSAARGDTMEVEVAAQIHSVTIQRVSGGKEGA